MKKLFTLIRVRPRILHEATTQSEAIELVSQEGVAALTTPAAAGFTAADVVFRRFSDEILTATTVLAYFGEPLSPILKSLRQFVAETFQPLREGWDGQKQMVLF